MDDYQIIITRASSFYGCAIDYSVELDGLPIGILKNGSTLSIPSTQGTHILSFISKGKIDARISVSVHPEQRIVRLFAKISGLQKIEVSCEAPEVNCKRVLSQKTPAIKKKKHPVLLSICIVFVALIAIMSIISGMNSSGEKSKPSELTDDEKAVEQIDKATKYFQSGDYDSALKICNQVSADYPETGAASNMEAYLKEQYGSFKHFSAEDLMSEYDANIVNADNIYTNTVMIVSGTVSSIGKTNGDSILTVMLNSGTYFYGVQLNFKTTQTDSVASLSEGDIVTAIGKCTGKSGKQLIILDGNNVMIENCYLIHE